MGKTGNDLLWWEAYAYSGQLFKIRFSGSVLYWIVSTPRRRPAKHLFLTALQERKSRVHNPLSSPGVTTSRATSWGRKNDPNTSGQRWNNFHTSYIDRSFVVSGNNRVVKPKCKQFTSLNKMLSNSKVLIVHISFTALINNEGIGGIRKVPRRIKCTFCSCRKQSCCKAEMLPSYTSLLKKLSNFPQALTGTILLMLY